MGFTRADVIAFNALLMFAQTFIAGQGRPAAGKN
jgi:hypothetical protein